MHWGFHPFGFFFFILLVGLLIVNFSMWRRRGGHFHQRSNNAKAILEERLASGDIDTEEYIKIKDILKI